MALTELYDLILNIADLERLVRGVFSGADQNRIAAPRTDLNSQVNT